ncbi:hypothetical protein ACIKK6_27825 [Bacillus thuringiensis]|uniref:hypothetical protein n=1 Tax=Bacillus thuringiensis TaxID=1428 RepID=UPI0037CF7695
MKGKDREVLGNKTKVKVVKNKVAPPFKNIHFVILYQEGITLERELIDIVVDLDIVQ